MGDQNKQAMASVLEDMGRAAREGRARRFTGRAKAKAKHPISPDDELEETGEGSAPASAPKPPLTDEDLKDLEGLTLEH
jgi:hypothetical protein